MKKCTMCADRIYNENLPTEERVPACVSVCPTGARHFGDLNDPNSGVSKLVREREGYSLMPEQGCKPVNRYLPPRPRKIESKDIEASGRAPRMLKYADDNKDGAGLLARLVDKVLSG